MPVDVCRHQVSMHLLVLSAFRLGWEGPGDALLMRVSMHLLVLSAFRHNHFSDAEGLMIGSQCTFWCSVLSVWNMRFSKRRLSVSQCTFWCSVLSVMPRTRTGVIKSSLNAPSGAQCFPSRTRRLPRVTSRSQCTFWCSVLSDVENWWSAFVNRVSQCTFWCSVLSDIKLKY
mgnify:CR=1 FL=1